MAASAESASPTRIALATSARSAAARRAASLAPSGDLPLAANATRIRASTWASRLLSAASTTALWKSRSAARRAIGSAHAASTRRSLASISAAARRYDAGRQSSRRRFDRRAHLVQLAEVADLVAAFEVGVQPSDDIGVEECQPAGRRTRVPVFGAHFDESLGLQHLDRLAHDGAADAQLGHEVVLVRQWRPGAPPTTHDPSPELVDDPAVETAPRRAELIAHAGTAPWPILAPR